MSLLQKITFKDAKDVIDDMNIEVTLSLYNFQKNIPK